MQHQSKFRENRAKKVEEEKGKRAQADELKAKPGEEQEEALEEQIAPGIHDRVERKARELHITHDHAAGRHHVTAMHDDGSMEDSDYGSAEEAHEAAAAAGTGNYPQKHKSKDVEPNPHDEFEVEPLEE